MKFKVLCEEDLAPDLDTVLMKTPISQKEERKKTDKDYQRFRNLLRVKSTGRSLRWTRRPCSSKSKQGESTTKSNPLNLTKLLANDAQRKVFEENFHGRAIFTPKYGNIGNFEFEDFLFPYLLRQQKLFDFCCEANDIYPELVRVFYCNMNFRKNHMTSHVKGKNIVLDMKTFSSICCDIPMIGDITGFGLEEIERRKQQSLGETVKNMDILSTGYLTLEDRLIHYFLSYVILPKFSNHSQISDIELQLMYAIKFKIKINWTKMIMNQMWHVRGSQSPLPYAIFITKILEHFGVPLEDHDTRRTYKHRTDHQPAPTDELEPTAAPHQPESHAKTSSSVAMPTNQMIMNELVSLRGYITTRMDAFDTQSQQIHYELHRLSSRLSNMDVDEDSSEPDQKGEKSWEAHNSKRKGEHTCIHIGGAYSRQVKIYHQVYCSHKITLSRRHWFVIIKKGEIVKKISDLGTVLMKTPTSPKRRKGRLLMKTKKIKASRQ
ncbi:hypothetical protein Lal_00031894 [Lupinus albus]|nr:hypothetical protein Lal_00031894 [Lupinus albus]